MTQSEVISALSSSILSAVRTMIDDNNRNVVYPNIKNNSGVPAIANTGLSAASITQIQALIDNAIDTAEITASQITDLTDEVARLAAIEVQSATITTAQIQDLSAYIANVMVANIGTANIDWANITGLNTQVASIANAQIGNATINWGQLGTLTADTVLLSNGAAGKLTIDYLNVNDANIVSISADKIYGAVATFGKVAISGTDTDGNQVLYELVIDSDTGNVVAQAVELDGDSVISDNSINGGDKIIDRTIDGTKLIAKTVTAGEIAAGTLTANEIAANTITAANIASSTITSNEIATGAITSDKVDAGAITAEKISANAITSDKIAANSVVADKIDSNAVTSVKINAGAVVSDKIAANAITADKIEANAITSAKIESSAITADKIAADAITTDKIAAGAITSGKISSDVGESLDISSNESINIIIEDTEGVRKNLESSIMIDSATPPADAPESGKIWLDRGVSPYMLRRWIGADVDTGRTYSYSSNGSIVQIDNSFGDVKSIDNVTAQITAVQAGTGDPSPTNVRPITGWAGATVRRCGKNLIDNSCVPWIATETGIRLNAWGYPIFSHDWVVKNLKPSTMYYAKYKMKYVAHAPAENSVVYSRKKQLTIYSGKSGYPQTNIISPDYMAAMEVGDEIEISTSFTTPPLLHDPNANYRILGYSELWRITEGSSVGQQPATVEFNDLIISDVDAPYEPYQGDVYDVDFLDENGTPQTVYGGTLDVGAGTLTVTHRMFNLAIADMNNSENYPGWINPVGLEDCVPDGTNAALTSAVCNVAKSVYANTVSASARVLLYNKANIGGLTQSQLKAQYPNLVVQILLPLSVPETYALTPTRITALEGINRIYADCGDVTAQWTGSGWENVSDNSDAIDSTNKVLSELDNSIRAWFKFGENGLAIGKSTSTYDTLTDDNGYHIRQLGQIIGSFAKRALYTEAVKIGKIDETRTDGVVMRQASDGGIVIVAEG